MSQRNNPLQALTATSSNDAVALLWKTLPLVAALVLVLVLISVQPGAGIGFA